jgi:hypothetical protein
MRKKRLPRVNGPLRNRSWAYRIWTMPTPRFLTALADPLLSAATATQLMSSSIGTAQSRDSHCGRTRKKGQFELRSGWEIAPAEHRDEDHGQRPF